MSENTSFADFLTDWGSLITAVRNNEETLPDLEGLVAPLEGLLGQGRSLVAEKAAARALLSEGSKRSRALVPEGRAAASRLRYALKVHFGGHNEKLVEFGIAPLRTRRLRQPADPPPPTPLLEVPETE